GHTARRLSSNSRSTAAISRRANIANKRRTEDGRQTTEKGCTAPLPIRPLSSVVCCLTSMQPVLELKGLSKSFGGLRAVRGVDLATMPGDRKAVIGPNGAGKTTLFNLITGILTATSGEVLLFGRDVTRWSSHRRAALGMARTFQVTSLFPRLTVLD